jgi:hypothetical protein
MDETTDEPEGGEIQERRSKWMNGWRNRAARGWRNTGTRRAREWMDEIKAEPEDEETLEWRRGTREMDDEVPKTNKQETTHFHPFRNPPNK